MPGVNAYKDKVVDRLWKGLQGMLASRKIEIVYGEGRWSRRPRSRWATRSTRARTWCWPPARSRGACPAWRSTASGSSPATTRCSSTGCPRSVVILGGGVIGVEFASVWRSFGAEVTIVEMLPHLLPLEDEASSKLLERAFRRRGIGYELGARFEGVKEHRHRRAGHAGGRQDARRRAAAGRGRPRAGLGGPGLRGGGRRDGARLRQGRRVLPDQRARRSPRSAT